jgi:hypothetical protein
MSKRFVHEGEHVTVVAPYSEVCMHLGIAGQTITAQLLPGDMVQMHNAATGNPISFPVTVGEAGLYRDGAQVYAVAP